MNNTSITTGVAVAAAIIIIVIFFFFRGSVYSLFSHNLTPSVTQKVSQTTQKTSKLPSTAQKLSIINVTVGTGTVAKQGDVITVDYIGKLSNGTIFDSSAAHKKPFTFVLGIGQVIQGWDEGLVGMKVGGTRILVIPPSLGYGNRIAGHIPANSTLTFEVKLIKVTSPKK